MSSINLQLEKSIPVSNRPKVVIPQRPQLQANSESEAVSMRRLRHFHLGDPQARSELATIDSDLLPALLNAYRDTSKLRYDYPLFLNPVGDGNCALCQQCDLAEPLSGYLSDLINGFAPGSNGARILKDNLSWFERAMRQHLHGVEGPVSAKENIEKIGADLVKHLNLKESHSEQLQQDLEKLIAAIPDAGKLLSYGRFPAIHLLIHIIRCKVLPRHRNLQQQISQLIRDLKTLLEVDQSKSAEALAPEKLGHSLGSLGSMFNTDNLSKVMDHSQGSIGLPTERRARIELTLQTLKGYQHHETIVHFVHSIGSDNSWMEKIPGFISDEAEAPCEAATTIFDSEAERLAEIFKAVRTAQLEIDNSYNPEIHDPWFATFNWESFTADELLLVPAVIALESATNVAGEGMPAFSRLLNSGRPVQIFVRVQAHHNPGAKEEDDPLQNFRTELGYLGISHRQAVVSQTSAARHQQLLNNYSRALDATRTSLHLLNTGLQPTGKSAGLNAWLVAGAALEGRVHPFFFINPAAGDSAAERVDFGGNPQQEKDWPTHEFVYLDAAGKKQQQEIAFTFADYALLIQRLHNHFVLIPENCNSADLLPIESFLELDVDATLHKIPYVWGINAEQKLVRLAISLALVQACRDRRNFWRTLQELGGVRSHYIDRAIAETQSKLAADNATKEAELEARFKQQLIEARATAATEVMGRLTEALLEIDLSGNSALLAGSSRPQPLAAIPNTTVTESDIEAKDDLEEEEIAAPAAFVDPWIDSPLCTTCNDCLVINPIMYVYNEDKQAYIADATAGTYAQLVEGAEICPAKCIHPGMPLNRDEPNLPELIERAAPFN